MRFSEVLSEALLGPSWSDLLRRGTGAQRSDVLRHVVYPIVAARWDIGEVPRLTGMISPAQRARACALTDEVQDVMRRAVVVQHALVDQAVKRSSAAGKPARPAWFSELAATRVGAVFAKAAGPHRDADCLEYVDIETLADELVARWMQRLEPLGPGAFAAEFDASFHECWSAFGAQALRASPPSSIGLGSDRRPPTTPVTSTTTWQLGSDRSLYKRYTLYFRASSQGEFVPRDGGSDPAHQEILRTCSGLGLLCPAHRSVLQSVFLAEFLPDPQDPDLKQAADIWRDWRAQVRPVGAGAGAGLDEALRRAASAKIRLWVSCAAPGRELVRRLGPAENYAALIQRALIRKLWMGLHERERRFESPVNSAGVNRLLGAALDKAVPEAVPVWRAIEHDRRADDPGGSIERSTRRQNCAYEMLTKHPELGRRVAASLWSSDRVDEALDVEYAAAATEDHGVEWPKRLLTLSELRDRLIMGQEAE